MAHRNRHSRARKSAPGWVWMLFGLSIGLVVAAAVYFRSAPASRVAATTTPVDAPLDEAGGSAPAPSAERPATRGARNGGAAQPEPSNEPRFDFYEILPQFEVVVPEVETPASPAARAPKAVEEPGSYVLQAGSFTALGDADRLKARIALLGIESRIQRVEIDNSVFHRVRIGPISDLDRLNRIRRQLRDARVETMLMKAQ